MTWRKRSLIFSVGLLVALLITGGILWQLHTRHPHFYRAFKWTPRQRGELAHQTASKLALVHNAFEEQTAKAALSLVRETGSTLPATVPSAPFTLNLNEEEINAFLMHAADIYGWKPHYEDYVTDPGVFLEDGHINIAGNVVEVGGVMSLVFDPRLDENGQLRMDLSQILSGRLPVPRVMLNSQIQKLTDLLEKNLPHWEDKAKFDPQGRANRGAAGAAMTKLLLNALNSKPSDPVIFLPLEGSDYAPLKVTAMTIKGNNLSMTMRLLTMAERTTYLDNIKAPYPPAR